MCGAGRSTPPDGLSSRTPHRCARGGVSRCPERGSMLTTSTDTSGREPDDRPLRRRGVQRLAYEQWGAGRSVWEAEIAGRDLAVDRLDVREGAASEMAGQILGPAGEHVWIRSRRFVLDGKPVLLSTSYLPAPLVEGTAITEPDTGPGGIYARLAELGHGPVRFREEVRSRMPLPEETAQLGHPAGTPVMLICRTAIADEGRVVEVNEMVLDAAAYVLEYDFDA
ncbi:GntR family transcriptional regulator [Streptomyces californicus]|uniref:GntR family transcriptional regulator n=1 Tax=Streptomyces californicus TaxID=67351 RepID=UPI00369EDD18